MTLPVTAQAAFAATLVDEWVRAGITDAVIAPGSRSTPLALALADAAGGDVDERGDQSGGGAAGEPGLASSGGLAGVGLRVHVVLDERSAGFMALGLAMVSGRPAPVLTTSGTAPAHLLPAVIEAHLSRVPMVVCTADRPPELHHVGAPQTIEQDRLYEGFLRWRADLGAVADLPSTAWRSIAARSLIEAQAGTAGPGPVQLNLAFRDPLVGVPGDLVPQGRPARRPWHVRTGRPTGAGTGGMTGTAVAGPVQAGAVQAGAVGPVPAAPGAAVEAHLVSGAVGPVPAAPGAAAPLVAAAAGPAHLPLMPLVSGRAGIILAGSGIADPGPVLELAKALGWPVLAGPRSGCRGGPPADDVVVVSAFDAILRDPATARCLCPAAVVHLGVPMASKVLASWLEGSGADHVVADPFDMWADPERHASLLFSAEPEALCRAILGSGALPAPEAWAVGWRAAETTAQHMVESVLAAHPEVTEPGVARAVTKALSADVALFVASSMPVRDVEWYGDPAMACSVLANRGANGIDGLVSTALGVAAGHRGPTVALLGDLALLHDSGALLGASRRGLDCTFVVVDNDGGGIFSFLPQAAGLAPARFELLFGTPHGTDLAALAAVHEIPVTSVADAAALGSAVGDALRAGGVRMVLVRTDRATNVAVHDELVASVTAALALGHTSA